MTIHLVPPLLAGSSDPPGNSDGPPSTVPLFGLAPGGVYQAPAVTGGAGELLPHPFTLTPAAGAQPAAGAVSFLWHFPSRRRDWALPSALSCGARTFLSLARTTRQRSFVLLQHTLLYDHGLRICVSNGFRINKTSTVMLEAIMEKGLRP